MTGTIASPTGKMPPIRLVILLGAVVSLLSGLSAALLRLGLPAPVTSQTLADLHGPLMVYGFLGTLITLERAVALQSDRKQFTAWAYAAPLASVLAVILSLVSAFAVPLPGGRSIIAGLWCAAMILLLVIYAAIWHRLPSIYLLIQLLGALAGLIGIALWGRGFEAAAIFPWWGAFLVLTILGERIELARLAFLKSGTELRILIEAIAFMAGLLLTLLNPTVGYLLLGLSLAALLIDICSHDVARRTINSQGLTRFMAACMLSGYAWAMLAAGIWTIAGPVYSGYPYDMVVHSLTIGFALSMVMAHAPVIIPAIARKTLPYSPIMWTVWGLLQISLIVRVVSGARDALLGWQFGGAMGVLSVLAFMITTLSLILFARQKALSQAAANKESL